LEPPDTRYAPFTTAVTRRPSPDAYDPQASQLCCRIGQSMDRLGLNGWQAGSTRMKLERNCGPC